jgi:tetratricopeptide (TPR) repeat protein
MDREARERQRKVVQVVAGFLSAAAAFEEIYQTYRQGSLSFAKIESFVDDRGKSLLFEVKEVCHALFRRNMAAGMEKEQLFDLAIGTIFHEAMKLREDLYQIESYGAKYHQLEEKEGRTKYEEDFLRQLRKIFRRAEVRLEEEMDETKSLFHETAEQLKTLLADFCSNGLLARFFHENADLVHRVFGGRGAEDLFEVMYPGGYPQSLVVAGWSYLESARFDKAHECFGRAAERGATDPALPALDPYARGMALSFGLNYEETVAAFEEAIPRLQNRPEGKGLLPVAARTLRRMAPDMRTRGRSDLADRAAELAARIERGGDP